MAKIRLVSLVLLGMLVAVGCSKGKGSDSKSSNESKDSGGEAPGLKVVDTPSAEDQAAAKAAVAKADQAATAFDKITNGMTGDQVKAIMGDPTGQFAMGEVTQMHWDKGAGKFVVHFKGDKVMNKTCNIEAPDNFPGTARKADFSKIKTGMTREEVVNVLGRPGQETSGMGEGAGGVFLRWQDGKTSLTVICQNNKVIAANIDSGDE